MNKKIYFLLLLLLVSISSYAARISGTVIDEENKEPLIGAIVVIKELNKAATTDADGAFEFTGIESGSYEIVFSMVTYKKALQSVSVLNNKDVTLNVTMKAEGNVLQDVTVKTSRVTNTENAVMMEVRKSNLVVSGISSAQIGKTQDRNAADVLKRIPGITIQDDRFVTIRGLTDRYNSVFMNDAGAPSSEVDKKSFSFDIIPSGLIDRILVYKTPAPELPSDFAGGMIKVYTSSLPDKNSITASYQSSYRSGSTGETFNYEPRSSTDWLGYDDGQRALPSAVPNYTFSRTDSNIEQITKSFKNDWGFKNKKLAPDGRFNLAGSLVKQFGAVKVGTTLGVSTSNTSTRYVVARERWLVAAAPDALFIDTQSVNNVRSTILSNTAVAWGNNKIEFKNLYNQLGRADVTVRNATRDSVYRPDDPDERFYKLQYESRAIYSTQLSGTHKTKSDNTSYNWTLGYNDLFKNTPNLRRIKYSKQKDEADSMYYAAVSSGVDPINGGGRFYSELYEKTYSFNQVLNQKVSIKKWNYDFEVNVGSYIEYKSRYFGARNMSYTMSPAPGANYMHLKYEPIDRIFADSNVGTRGKFLMADGSVPTDQYNASNRLIAGFLALKLPVGDKINVYGGVRYEDNVQKLEVDSVETPVHTKFLLPSINATYNFNEKMLVRAAYGKTLNRPEFRENAPFFFYDFDQFAGTYGATFDGILQQQGVNDSSGLKVAEIHNVDLRWEWYPNQGEMVHAGVFYKSFKNPIQQVIVPGSASDGIDYTFMNMQKAYTMGLEVEVRKNLEFADKWFNTDVFKNFALVGNAAFIKSEVNANPKDTIVRLLSNTPLQGQSPYMINLGLFYQNDSIGFSGSVLYNVSGAYTMLLGSKDIPSIGMLPFNSLDILLSKTFYKHYSVSFGVQNLLDAKLTTVSDLNSSNTYAYKDGSADKLNYQYKPGRYFTLGIKIKF